MTLVERPGPVKGSPRPDFAGPAHIRRADATRHVWGEPASGEVFDWIYASTSQVHALVFGLPPGHGFRHSEDFRTVFGADEVLHVLEGTMVLADPEHGEVQRVEAGQQVSFGRDTWHHAYAHGTEPLRVLELFAPPPAAGASSAYAKTRPYLDAPRYALDGGAASAAGRAPRLRVIRAPDVVWQRDLGVLTGVLLATEQLTVHTLELGPGEAALPHRHGGDEVLFALEGPLWVRVWHEGAVSVFELEAEDACFIPEGADHEYRNPGGGLVRALAGIAPRYDVG